MHQIPTLKRFSYCLAAFFAESLEARCQVENEKQRRQAMLQLHLSERQFYCLLRCHLYFRFYINWQIISLLMKIIVIHQPQYHSIYNSPLLDNYGVPTLSNFKKIWILWLALNCTSQQMQRTWLVSLLIYYVVLWSVHAIFKGLTTLQPKLLPLTNRFTQVAWVLHTHCLNSLTPSDAYMRQ